MKRFTRGRIAVNLFTALLAALVLIPLLMVFSRSVASKSATLSGSVGILPDFSDLHWDAYHFVLQNERFRQAFINTLAFTALGTLLGVISTVGFAYALSKPYLRGQKFLLTLAVFAMYFSGGKISTYITMSRLHLVNTFHILYLAGIFNVANMLVLKNTFESIPKELEESAMLDGAGPFTALWYIVLPLSKSTVAVIALFYIVDYWNNYFTSMMFTTNQSLKSLQLVLRETISASNDVFTALREGAGVGEATGQSVTAACIVISALPICLLFPVLHRFLKDGLMTGAMKE